MAKNFKQQYGIKFPFTSDTNNGYIIDLNQTIKSKIRSILIHIIFTPKGQKLRDPNFGTDLIKYIFEPNDVNSWNSIKESISDAVGQSLPQVVITDLDVLKEEDDPHQAYVKIAYSVSNSSTEITDSIIVPV